MEWANLRCNRICTNCFLWLGRIISSRYSPNKTWQEYWKSIDKESDLFPKEFIDFIKKKGIKGIGFNTIRQLNNNYSNIVGDDLRCSIHRPYAYLTTTRTCGCLDGYEGYYRNSLKRCNNDCFWSRAEQKRRLWRKVFIKGNTHFIDNGKDNLSRQVKIDRLVDNRDLMNMRLF